MKKLNLPSNNPLNLRDPDVFVPTLIMESGLVIDKTTKKGKHTSLYYCSCGDARTTQAKIMAASKRLCSSPRWVFPRWPVGLVNSLTTGENTKFELKLSVSQTRKVVTIAVILKGVP